MLRKETVIGLKMMERVMRKKMQKPTPAQKNKGTDPWLRGKSMMEVIMEEHPSMIGGVHPCFDCHQLPCICANKNKQWDKYKDMCWWGSDSTEPADTDKGKQVVEPVYNSKADTLTTFWSNEPVMATIDLGPIILYKDKYNRAVGVRIKNVDKMVD